MPQKKNVLQQRIRPSTPVKINVDGKEEELLLSFDFKTLARIEERTGLHLAFDIFALWKEISSVRVLAATFWASLLNDQPEYDSEDGYVAAASLMIGNVERIASALTDAYPAFLSEPQAEAFRRARLAAEREARGEPPQDPPEDPTSAQAESPASSAGSDSGPSPDTTSVSASASSAS